MHAACQTVGCQQTSHHQHHHTPIPCLQTIQCHLDLQELVKGWHLLLAEQAVHIQHVLPYSQRQKTLLSQQFSAQQQHCYPQPNTMPIQA
jgi:hypothetical protein